MSQEAIFFGEMQMATFSLWVVAIRGSPIPISVTAEMAKFQIVVQLTSPSEVSERTPGGLSNRRGERNTYWYNSLSITNGLSYKQRTKKVMSQKNTITMTASWKNDVELEDVEICHGIRRNRTVGWDDEKLKGRKIRRYVVTPMDHGESLGKCPKYFKKYGAAKKSIESQISTIFKYKRDAISFHLHFQLLCNSPYQCSLCQVTTGIVLLLVSHMYRTVTAQTCS